MSVTDDRQVGGEHYNGMGDYQPWAVAKAWLTREEFLGSLKFGVIKYVGRAGRKDEELSNLHKARHYLDELIDELESEVPETLPRLDSEQAPAFSPWPAPAVTPMSKGKRS